LKTFLGVDGGGTKTEFVLIDETGRVLAKHQEGSAYYLEIGLDGLESMLAGGIAATLKQASVTGSQLTFAFVGIPAYGEDSRLLERLNSAASPALARGIYRCGNDMVCGWAGALGCRDGVNVVSGTGSIAYGEFQGRQARAGGWGELFSDEGSAHWVAREGLNLFSRMSDGRAPQGPLLAFMRAHFNLALDLDLCAAVYGAGPASRRNIAQLAPMVAEAARCGDLQARSIFTSGALELAAIVDATRVHLQVPIEVALPVSYSGGMFKLDELVLEPFQSALRRRGAAYEFIAPRLPPAAGAALYAAKCTGTLLNDTAVAALEDAYPSAA
jgi:N-acetylglucosamine kinase-like BadF-type ATPase